MPQRSALAVIDAILVRGLIPFWVLAGAVFKLIERTPGNLPSVIRQIAMDAGHRDWLNPFMRVAIGVELVAVAIMVFIPRLARLVAISILTLFCIILIAELVRQSGSCGCMGAVKMHPGVMLAIDGGMLAGAVALGLLRRRSPALPVEHAPQTNTRGAVIASVVGVLGIILAVAVPERSAQEAPQPGNNGQQPIVADNGNSSAPDTPVDRTTPPPQNLPPGTIANPSPAPLPGFYLPTDPSAWVGMPATQVDLIKLMRIWPEDIANGTRHIIFYSRTCDHCEMMFHDHLGFPHDRPITVVEIPFDRSRMRGPGAWAMPEVEVQQLSLPIGSDWVMTPPLIVTIENGTVTCAQEGSYEDCLGVEPTHEH